MGAQHSRSDSSMYVELTDLFSLHYSRLTIYYRCGAPRCPLVDWISSMDVIILGDCESISHTICHFSSYRYGHM